MTLFIPAYDTERPACLAGCRKIADLHRRYGVPATFFITGQELEARPKEYRALLDDPLFFICSHTYSHKMFRDHPFCGQAVSLEEMRQEILLGKEWVERVFDRPCIGLRFGCGYVHGLSEAPQMLPLVRKAGLDFVSSILWGPLYSIPAPLTQAFNYAERGYPDVWEFPGHGWHENLLKGANQWGAKRLLLYPSIMPGANLDGFVKSPEEEFQVNNRRFIDQAIADDLDYVSLIWHPWSIDAFDPELRMLEMTFRYLRERGLQAATFADLLGRMRKRGFST